MWFWLLTSKAVLVKFEFSCRKTDCIARGFCCLRIHHLICNFFARCYFPSCFAYSVDCVTLFSDGAAGEDVNWSPRRQSSTRHSVARPRHHARTLRHCDRWLWRCPHSTRWSKVRSQVLHITTSLNLGRLCSFYVVILDGASRQPVFSVICPSLSIYPSVCLFIYLSVFVHLQVFATANVSGSWGSHCHLA